VFGIQRIIYVVAQSIKKVVYDFNQISVSNIQGDSIFEMELKGDPSNIKTFKSIADVEYLTVVVNKRSIVVFIGDQYSNPVEFQMNSKYGNIVDYFCTHSDYIVVGFESGHVVCMSQSIDYLIRTREYWKGNIQWQILQGEFNFYGHFLWVKSIGYFWGWVCKSFKIG
jgi:hypothetical protein